jgi:hypothetical protein
MVVGVCRILYALSYKVRFKVYVVREPGFRSTTEGLGAA